ncbi:MAG: EFR1 family ferrodoxin [Desulfitobacteriaceae bacterium]|nr:EFR1 family ferrodoxin [Desulfitobacteriaceae bacterium]MDD4347073.1 EFR1 family ferrodoxin [Desulfitobacteriaceae bacterium]MDD4401988.1 EFR1 family ferrodoxin [Desulfitobacteriaceae bacterium]
MRTTIFYFSGTGNSLWIAQVLARELGETEVVSMVNWNKKQHIVESRRIGLIFPVYMWGVPRRVLEFLDQLPAKNAEYIFAVANNAGQVANTLVQLDKTMQAKGLLLSSGWSIVMPSNYIPWGGPVSLGKQNELFKAARLKISYIVQEINQRAEKQVEKGPLWQRIIFSGLYKISSPHIPKMDGKFWADEKCNKCGICIQLCPNNNISRQDDKLTWHNHCEQCLACIQWCPQGALQYGRKTSAYSRYHHPDIKLKDLLS